VEYNLSAKRIDNRTYYYLGRLCGFILACRKLYTEARLLPFQFNTFYSGKVYTLVRLADPLNETYRSAISTLQVDFELL
jgi:hypothetical protein